MSECHLPAPLGPRPESHLSSNVNIFVPNKILSCMMRVNSVPFNGLPAGTVQMRAPTFRKYREPVSTFDGLNPFYSYDIAIPFVYMNPPLGVPDEDETVNATPRGHRCMPYSGNSLRYAATRTESTLSNPIYLFNEADLNTKFRHTSDPG